MTKTGGPNWYPIKKWNKPAGSGFLLQKNLAERDQHGNQLAKRHLILNFKKRFLPLFLYFCSKI